MEYIFDFDHTLFNTPRFSDDAMPYKSNGLHVTPAIWDILDAQTYVYDDVIDFVKNVGKAQVRILTAITPELGPQSGEFQKAKLHRSGISEYVSDIVFMEGEKGLFVKAMYSGNPTVFVDDKLEQLLAVKALCPEVLTVQIARPGIPNEKIGLQSDREDIPVVKTLSELATLVL